MTNFVNAAQGPQPFSALYAEIRLFANQCPDTTIDKGIIRALRIFCQDSRFYQKSIDINEVDQQSVYPLVFNGSTDEVIGVESVQQDNRPMYPLDQKDYSMAFGGIIRGFQFEPPNLLVIVPTPSQFIQNGIQARLILQPTESATTIDESVYRRWKYAIQDGALAFILGMQNEPWSNPMLAMEKQRTFEIAISKAYIQRDRGFQSRNLMIKPRSFLP